MFRTMERPRWALLCLFPCLVLGMARCGSAQQAGIEATSVIPMARAAGNPARGITVDVRAEGDSSRKARQTAIEQIPLAQLTRPGQQSVKGVLDDLSLFRRLPTIHLAADRRVYEFFTGSPDVAVSLWRAMDISRVQMWQTGPNDYETDTRDGTWGKVEVLLRAADHYVIYCTGHFQNPAIKKPIQASAIMHLQPVFGPNGDVTHTLDLFVSFPSQTVETVAKIISPVSNRIADRNFEEVSLFIVMMSTAMQTQPGWVHMLTQKLDGVLAERPQQLLTVTSAVYFDAEKQRMAERGGPVGVERLPAANVQQAGLVPPAPR